MKREARHTRHKDGDKKSALIVIDMISDYDHSDGEILAEQARRIILPLNKLIDRAQKEGLPIIYVNDNFNSWTEDKSALINSTTKGKYKDLVKPILPPDDAHFMFKARHSIFYQTALEYLLDQENISRVILTGQVTEQCILYSALDAYVRHFEVVVAQDCVASIKPNLGDSALEMMKDNMQAEVKKAKSIDF